MCYAFLSHCFFQTSCSTDGNKVTPQFMKISWLLYWKSTHFYLVQKTAKPAQVYNFCPKCLKVAASAVVSRLDSKGFQFDILLRDVPSKLPKGFRRAFLFLYFCQALIDSKAWFDFLFLLRMKMNVANLGIMKMLLLICRINYIERKYTTKRLQVNVKANLKKTQKINAT